MRYQNPNFEHRENATHRWPQQTTLPSARAPEDNSQDRSRGHSGEFQTAPQHRTYTNTRALSLNLTPQFEEAQRGMFAADNVTRMNSLKDELTLAAGKVTPGVDDAPYIQYALDALTREHQGPSASQRRHRSSAAERCSDASLRQPEPEPMVEGFVPDQSMREEQLANKLLDTTRPRHQPSAHFESSNIQDVPSEGEAADLQPPRHQSCTTRGHGQWIPIDKGEVQRVDTGGETYQPLTFRPRILRLFSMALLTTLSALMLVGLMFSTLYSEKHHGLTPYPGSIYSGQYFVFRILPQLLGSIILIYAQNIVAASLRIIPFATMAREDPQERYLALFQTLHPKTFLLPQLSGPWQLQVFGLATWLMNFTVPLQSAAFTVITDNGESESGWIWAPTKGVIWTLVALYAVLVIATVILTIFWSGRWTGLLWDVRSIADFIPLISRSNTLRSYRRDGLFGPNPNFKAELQERWFDRLGYWKTKDATTSGIWLTIGASAIPLEHQHPGIHHADGGASRIGGARERQSNELSVDSYHTGSSALLSAEVESYMPLSLRSLPLAAFVLVTGSLVMALLIVSFLPQTRLETGFAPLITARPNSAAFSAANFLYSFLPAALGMLLFLLFQSPDGELRTLQPWAALGRRGGALASRSILADYAACLPFQATYKALRNGHWRVAVISFMSTLFIFIPILSGGLFMALTTPQGQVRMFPNMPVFGNLLALLILYVGCLGLLIPHRHHFRLPHSVTTIASVISFCTAKELVQDAAFRSANSRADLMDRLGVGRRDHQAESAWHLGLLAGRDETRVGVRRMNRYTEKMTLTRPMNSMV